MKKFSEMNLQELEQIVNRSKEMRDKLEDYIQTCEFDYISDKMRCIKPSLRDWSIGFYNQNFINVKDYNDFLDCVIDCKKSFGASDRMEKKISQCEKLRGTNLFEYHCKQLEEMFMEDEIKCVCDFVEDCGMELYYGKVGDKCRDYLELFFEIYDDYLYDEETETFYKPTKLDAA